MSGFDTLDLWRTGAALAAAAVLVAVGSIFWRVLQRRRARLARRTRIAAISIDFVRDVLLPDGVGGQLHLDYLLWTPLGLLVLDLREVRGHVFGGDHLAEWTVMDGVRRITFPNPQETLYDRLAALRALAPEFQVDGRIVFADLAELPKLMPRFTIRESSLTTDFVMGDRELAARAVGDLKPAWERVKATLQPSPVPRNL